MGLIGFYWVLLDFTLFYCDIFQVLPRYIGFYWVLLGFTLFYWVELSFSSYDWVCFGLIEFYWL